MLDVTEICGGTLMEHVDGNIECTLMRSGECLGLGREHKTRIDCWLSDDEGCFKCKEDPVDRLAKYALPGGKVPTS